MGDWLKDKYKDLLAQGLIAALCVMLGFWAYGFRDRNNLDELRLKKLEQTKAEKTWVNEKCIVINSNIDKKADKSLVESMDKKLDLILLRLK